MDGQRTAERAMVYVPRPNCDFGYLCAVTAREPNDVARR